LENLAQGGSPGTHSRHNLLVSHSFTSNFVHFVFSTKHRKNFIPEDMLTRTWEYLSGVAKNHDIKPVIAGGTRNHVHVLAIVPAQMSVSEAARVMKCNTSRWLREQVPEFDWQEGYGAFSVSPPHAGAVMKYIRNQEEHHRKKSFEEEFAAMLKICGVDYDPVRK
jgi:putative transposase